MCSSPWENVCAYWYLCLLTIWLFFSACFIFKIMVNNSWFMSSAKLNLIFINYVEVGGLVWNTSYATLVDHVSVKLTSSNRFVWFQEHFEFDMRIDSFFSFSRRICHIFDLCGKVRSHVVNHAKISFK